jgi:cytoskeletal protein CcmA (bactofilin family)
MAEGSNDFPTTIGADAVFKGQLQFEKGVRLLGKFEGEINSDGQLVVSEGASLTGDVKASAIRIEGEVKGNMDAKNKISLSASARLEGDAQTQRLEVAEGAVLVGRCTVGLDGAGGRGGSTIKSATQPASAVTPSKARVPEPATAGAKR